MKATGEKVTTRDLPYEVQRRTLGKEQAHTSTGADICVTIEAEMTETTNERGTLQVPADDVAALRSASRELFASVSFALGLCTSQARQARNTAQVSDGQWYDRRIAPLA